MYEALGPGLEFHHGSPLMAESVLVSGSSGAHHIPPRGATSFIMSFHHRTEPLMSCKTGQETFKVIFVALV